MMRARCLVCELRGALRCGAGTFDNLWVDGVNKFGMGGG